MIHNATMVIVESDATSPNHGDLEAAGSSPQENVRLLGVLGFFVALGTVVRLAYGLRAELWNAAPDQLAWSILLAEAANGPVRWDQLIHAPHEGGTVVISLMALAFGGPLLGMPALSWIALLLDTAMRCGMIAISWRLLGIRTATLFAAWSVFAVPSLLPWATVNYGLHAFAAIWPFVAMLILSRELPLVREAVVLGLVTGAAISFSYDSAMLVFPGVVVLLIRNRAWKGVQACIAYLTAAAAAVAPHVAARLCGDAGFHLSGGDFIAVRNLEFSVPSASGVATRIWVALTETLPESALLPELGPFSQDLVRLVSGSALVLGLVAVIWTARRNRGLVFGLATAASWIVLYSASPVAISEITTGGYVAYRHFTSVLPLLFLLALHGASRGSKALKAVGVLLVATSVCAGVTTLFEVAPSRSPNIRGTGWVLGVKLGHDPSRLEGLLQLVPGGARPELASGFGWGITAAVLGQAAPPAAAEVRRLEDLVRAFSRPTRAWVIRGSRYAWFPGVTPRIHRDISRPVFRSRRTQPP